jgi:hypothetical protein
MRTSGSGASIGEVRAGAGDATTDAAAPDIAGVAAPGAAAAGVATPGGADAAAAGAGGAVARGRAAPISM